MMKIAKIIIRIITLPFVMCLILIATVRLFFLLTADYLFHGGEMVVFSKKFNQNTISAALSRLVEDK